MPDWRSRQRLRILRADHHHHVAGAVAERVLPLVGRAVAEVAEHLCARRHAVAELGREGFERAVGEPERLEAREAERDVDPGGRLVGPVLGADHLRDELAERGARRGGVVDAQEQVRGEREPVAAHDEALDVLAVDLGHRSGKVSMKRVLRSVASSFWPSSTSSSERAPAVEVLVHLLDRHAAVGGEEQRRVERVGAHVGREAGPVGVARIAAAVAPDRVGLGAHAGAQALQVGADLAVVVAGEQQARRERVAPPLGGALVDDVADHHPARDVRPGHARERARVALAEAFQVGGELRRVAVEDRREDAERVRLAGDVVAHRCSCTSVSIRS